MEDQDDNVEDDGNSTLRSDITDLHYAQLFFVVGHVAIKMLTYVEQMDNELKRSGTEAFQQKETKEQKKQG